MQWFHSLCFRSTGDSRLSNWLFYFNFFGVGSGETFFLCLSSFFAFFLCFLKISIRVRFGIFHAFLFLIIITFLFFLRRIDFFNNPCQPKITNFDNKSLPINKHIGWFEVPMHNVGRMKVLQSTSQQAYPHSIWYRMKRTSSSSKKMLSLLKTFWRSLSQN